MGNWKDGGRIKEGKRMRDESRIGREREGNMKEDDVHETVQGEREFSEGRREDEEERQKVE